MRFLLSFALALALLAAPALAHPGHETGFAAGFEHPLLGLDHVLAMITIGLWAAQGDARRVWRIPAAFLAGMAGGIGIGATGLATAAVEPGVTATVLVLGLLVALAVPMPLLAALALATGFGLLHGLVHGAEISGATAATALGMLLASALLHGAGLALGLALGGRAPALRLGGAAVACAGLALIAL